MFLVKSNRKILFTKVSTMGVICKIWVRDCFWKGKEKALLKLYVCSKSNVTYWPNSCQAQKSSNGTNYASRIFILTKRQCTHKVKMKRVRANTCGGKAMSITKPQCVYL